MSVQNQTKEQNVETPLGASTTLKFNLYSLKKQPWF